MTVIPPRGATIPEATHHLAELNGTQLHYVSAGDAGSPILLVHGWPETWWAFHKLIPLLAQTHRVYAVDIRGFGDSATTDEPWQEQAAADDLHELVNHLGVGAVHLLCQDISGGVGFRLAATHAADIVSFTAVESTLAGFGLEMLADVNAFGSWHVGFLGAPGIPSLLLPGRERALLAEWAYPMMNGTDGAISEADLDEFVRTYSRTNAWRGSESLYSAIFSDKGATAELATQHPITAPVLAVGGVNHPFTANSFQAVSTHPVASVHIEGVGHLIAQEAPQKLAAAMLDFIASVEGEKS
jgi:pimeloyl-ACP methyl ester carboxylesterase